MENEGSCSVPGAAHLSLVAERLAREFPLASLIGSIREHGLMFTQKNDSLFITNRQQHARPSCLTDTGGVNDLPRRCSMHARRLFLAAGLGLTAAVSTNSAWAGPKIFSSGAAVLTVNGTTETTANGNVDPFTAEVFTNGSECLRIAVTVQGADLEATLLSPGGTIWQDDDSGGSNRPLIKAVTTTRGWYPLSIAHFAGSAVNADFTMTVQRAASSSSLCSPATQPRSAVAARTAKSGGTGPRPTGGPSE